MDCGRRGITERVHARPEIAGVPTVGVTPRTTTPWLCWSYKPTDWGIQNPLLLWLVHLYYSRWVSLTMFANVLIDKQVTNQIRLRREEDSANSLILYCGIEGRDCLPIHITRGTAERPAGIPLSFSSTSRDLHQSNINCREYSSIRITFPDRKG